MAFLVMWEHLSGETKGCLLFTEHQRHYAFIDREAPGLVAAWPPFVEAVEGVHSDLLNTKGNPRDWSALDRL
jgi:hypothetical protein